VDLDRCRFNLRVAAVVECSQDVLICRVETEDWWFLPGGRVKTNESFIDALARELDEELGGPFQMQRPMVCVENFFRLHGVSFHELCMVYAVEWLGERAVSRREGIAERLRWVPRAAIASVDLRPALLKRYIADPPSHLELVTHRGHT
jgi:ADP-ribose pyrophosphatase YjhB (NUDIX family)